MNDIKLTAISTTVFERDHAVLTGDGFVNSVYPGWTNCTVNVVINEAMGAKFCQLLVTPEQNAILRGKNIATQIFFYVVEGTASVTIDGAKTALTKGSYVYIPVGKEYVFDSFGENTQLLTFHKKFEALEGYEIPSVVIGNEADVPQNIYCDDPDLLMKNLLPDSTDMAFDMAINIFTYNPGANLPFVETHIMEHGLMYLQGQGVYRLADKWYPIKKGDSIWMAPYCPQWFGALGKEPAVYIYYKNVNRFPIQP